MPELPEVENVRLGLERLGVPGQTFGDVELMRANLRTPLSRELVERLPGQIIRRVRRRAKFLLFETDADVVVSHLGMTGSWRLADQPRAHDHVRWRFRSGLELVFNDPRRFGILELVRLGEEDQHPWLEGLAPEPLSDEFDAEYLHRLTRGGKSAIKAVLMDQRRVVGVGNIYASEVLHRAGVKPSRAAGRVTRDEATRLVAVIKEVLREAIELGGSTIRDYRNAEGDQGGFQERFRVYGRDGAPCRACRRPIRARVIAGRSTYWCTKCQR